MDDSRFDEILRLLADQYRRQIIYTLQQSPEAEVSFDGLIDALHQSPTTEGVPRERLAIQAHHNHLPKLHELSVIEYDPDSNLVRYTPDHQFEDLVEDISAQESILVSDD